MNTNRVFAGFMNFFRRWKVKKNRVTLIEKLPTGGTGGLYEMVRECRRRDPGLKFHVITHRDYRVSLSNLPGLIRLFTVKAYMLATSSYIFLNDNFLPMAYMDLDPETTVVQLWHGIGSFKKFGASSETDEKVLRELREASRRVTYILAGSVNIRGHYAQAFMVPEHKVLTIGCPQVDYYFRDHSPEKTRRELEDRYPSLRGKKLVLYAPTFRDDPERDRDLLSHFDFEAFSRRLGEKYCLGVRLHPQIRGSRVPDGVIDFTEYKNVRQLLCMTDILIADYSSIAVEYSLLERPIILYAYDKKWYLNKDRGFYFDYDSTAPGPVVETMDELIDCIMNRKWDLDKVRAFAHLHNDYFDAENASRVAEFLFETRRKAKMKMIVGLGNPTDKYKGTRHNIGFMALDRLADAYGITVRDHKFKALTGSGFIGGHKVLLVKPLTFMNLSGESVRQAADYYHIDPEDILVIYDDISLEPGLLRIRKKGSAGGHNGMKSLIRHLGCDTFPRIRVGIGGERHPDMDLADYVLGRIDEKDREDIDRALENAVEASALFAEDELDTAMNRYSAGKKKRKQKDEETV